MAKQWMERLICNKGAQISTLYHSLWVIVLYCTTLIVSVWKILIFVAPQLWITRVEEMGLDPASLHLDQQLLHFMDQLEILEEKRQKLNMLIEEVRNYNWYCECILVEYTLCSLDRFKTVWFVFPQGWFNISKARYSMGNKQVSALQYASEMEALVHVYARCFYIFLKLLHCTSVMWEKCGMGLCLFFVCLW